MLRKMITLLLCLLIIGGCSVGSKPLTPTIAETTLIEAEAERISRDTGKIIDSAERIEEISKEFIENVDNAIAVQIKGSNEECQKIPMSLIEATRSKLKVETGYIRSKAKDIEDSATVIKKETAKVETKVDKLQGEKQKLEKENEDLREDSSFMYWLTGLGVAGVAGALVLFLVFHHMKAAILVGSVSLGLIAVAWLLPMLVVMVKWILIGVFILAVGVGAFWTWRNWRDIVKRVDDSI